MNDFSDMFIFIKCDIIVKMFNVSEMCLFRIKLFI